MKITAVCISLLGAALGAGCASTPPPSATERAPVPVSVGNAEIVDIPSSFEAGGVVRARATAVIASRVMAPVAVVHVRAGDRVRRGAPLVTLDAREITANSTRASAALTSAIEAARAAESDTQAADAALRLARATHERINTCTRSDRRRLKSSTRPSRVSAPLRRNSLGPSVAPLRLMPHAKPRARRLKLPKSASRTRSSRHPLTES